MSRITAIRRVLAALLIVGTFVLADHPTAPVTADTKMPVRQLQAGTNGQVLTTVSGEAAWAAAGGSSSGFPITIGSTSISGGSTVTDLAGLTSINGFKYGLSASATSFNMGLNVIPDTATGTSNIAVGAYDLNALTTGTYNTAVGLLSLYTDTTGGYNTAVGYGSLQVNTTGAGNSAFGYWALNSNVGGTNNTALGELAMRFNTSGGANTAVGLEALRENTTGNYNTAVGMDALAKNTYANSNTAVGYYTLVDSTTGGSNTAFGYMAMHDNNDGSNNVAIGANAGYSGGNTNQHYNNSVFLGMNAVPSVDSLTNVILIGYGATASQSNTAVIGNSSTALTVLYGSVQIPAVKGPVTAPSGSCSTSGVWVFSQDGHVSFCDGTSWTTKI